MRPILFSLGSLNFYSYGFFTALGFILAGAVADYLARKKRLLTSKHREYFLIDTLLFSLVCGLVAARLAYIVLYNLIFRTEPLSLTTRLFGGGFVFYVGIAVGLAAYYWWLKREQVEVMPWLDVAIVGIVAGYTLSQIGGYLNDASYHHLVGLLGGSILTAVSYQICTTERAPGRCFFVTLLLLAILQFFLGFWQQEVVSFIGLGLGQYVSLAAIITLSTIAFRPIKRKAKPKEE